MVIAIILSLVLAWVLDYSQYLITARNYGSSFNGKGCIADVLAGQALAPMQYRIAVPYLYKLFGHYEAIKIGLMALGLFSMWLMINTIWGANFALIGMLITAIFYTVNFQFDYTEQYLELAMWAQLLIAIYIGNVYWIFLTVIIASLNRETALFMVVIYFLSTFDVMMTWWFLGTVLLVMALLRLKYGIKESYLDKGVYLGNEEFKGKNHFRKNMTEIRKGFLWVLHPTWFTIMLVVLGFAVIVLDMFPTKLQYAPYVVIPFIIVLVTRAMFHEGVRIMLPLLVFIVPGVIKILGVI